jgi:hypothetical protein
MSNPNYPEYNPVNPLELNQEAFEEYFNRFTILRAPFARLDEEPFPKRPYLWNIESYTLISDQNVENFLKSETE